MGRELQILAIGVWEVAEMSRKMKTDLPERTPDPGEEIDLGAVGFFRSAAGQAEDAFLAVVWPDHRLYWHADIDYAKYSRMLRCAELPSPRLPRRAAKSFDADVLRIAIERNLGHLE